MQLITILTIQLSLMLVGSLLAILLGVKKRLEILSLSYLLGSGLITILFLILHWFLKLELNQSNFLLSLTLSFISLLLIIVFSKKTKVMENLFKFKLKKHHKNLIKIEKYIISIIILMMLYSFFKNYFWPIIDWDAQAFYDFRARVMIANGNMLEGIELKYFFQYPPYTSFLHVFGYLFGTERVKIAYSFIYFAFTATFFNLIRRKQNRLISLIFTLLLSSTPMIFEHSSIAYSNLPFTAFFATGLIYLWIYLEKGILKDLLVGGLLISLSTWIRSTEPFWIAGSVLIISSTLKHRINFVPSALMLFLLNIPSKVWRSFLIQLNNSSSIKIIDVESHTIYAIKEFLAQGQSFSSIVFRILEVLKYLLATIFPEFILIAFLLVLATIGNLKQKKIEIFSLVILLGIIFGGTLIFSFTFDSWDLIGGSIVRMAMAFIPLVLYATAKDFKYEKKN